MRERMRERERIRERERMRERMRERGGGTGCKRVRKYQCNEEWYTNHVANHVHLQTIKVTACIQGKGKLSRASHPTL